MKPLNKNAFTLVELMIVLATMAILTAIALPNFRGYMAQKRLSGAARELYGDLSLARSHAVSLNKWVALNIDNDHQCTIFRDDNKDGVVDSGEAIVTKDIHPTYYDVLMTTAPGAVYTFYPNGTGSTGTLNVASAAGTRTITVSSAGRIRISP